MSQNKNQRFNYLINKPFQFRFLAYTLIPNLISILVMYLGIKYFFFKQYSYGLKMKLDKNHAYFLILNEQSELFNTIFILLLLAMFILFLVWGVFISHKIAGPIFRLVKELNQEAQPDGVKELKFRPGDFFQEIPDGFNKFVETYKIKKK